MIYPARAILIIDLAPFGQSLPLLDAMRGLRVGYPNAFVAAAAATGICELLSAAGLVDEAIELGVQGRGGIELGRIARLMRKTRRRRFDLVLDFSPSLGTAILSRFLLRARTITPAKLPRVIQLLAGIAQSSHEWQNRYDEVLAEIGLAMKQEPMIALPQENAQFEARLKRSGSRGGEPVVMLYSEGSLSGWPVERFVDTGTRLANGFGARLIVADQPGSRVFTAAIGGALPAGSLKLSEPRALELLSAAARASLVITDEPGFAGLAASLGAPVIELSTAGTAVDPRADHRVLGRGSSADEVFDMACGFVQKSRTDALLQR